MSKHGRRCILALLTCATCAWHLEARAASWWDFDWLPDWVKGGVTTAALIVAPLPILVIAPEWTGAIATTIDPANPAWVTDVLYVASGYSTPFALAPPLLDAWDDGDTHLRCHYTLKSDPTGVKTNHVATGHTIPGRWITSNPLLSRSLFFADMSAKDARAACENRLVSEDDVGQLVMVGAAIDNNSYNYDIWYNGDQNPDAPVERIVSFGDSLSDTGNMYHESDWMLPGKSWFLGRFSNGPVWVEYLATSLDIPLNNWAVGGAQTENAQFGTIHGMGEQIESFFRYTAHAKHYDISRTLFTFLAGANDFVNDTKLVSEVIDGQEHALSRLVDGGARKILVVDLPDVSKAPVFTMEGGRTDARDVLDKVEAYNMAIRAVAARVERRAEGTRIIVVNAREKFDQFIDPPDRPSSLVTYESLLQIDSPGSLAYVQEHPMRLGGRRFADDYVFWDALHPTTIVHRHFADWAAAAAPPEWQLAK